MKIKDFFKSNAFKELLVGFLSSVLSLIVKTNFADDKDIKKIEN